MAYVKRWLVVVAMIGLLSLVIGGPSLAGVDQDKHQSKMERNKGRAEQPTPASGVGAGNRTGQAPGECLVSGETGAAYATIQSAIDEPSCGTIVLAPGTVEDPAIYEGDLVIDRSLTLQGGGRSERYWAETIIEGSGSTPAISIRGDAVVLINGVTVRGGDDGLSVHDTSKVTLQNSDISNNPAFVSSGIEIWDAAEAVIQHNIISRNGFNGLWVSDRSKATIRNNLIADNLDGDGILLLDDAEAEISDNEITGNAWCGVESSEDVFIFEGQLTGERNEVSGNVDGQLCGDPPAGWPPNFLGSPEGGVGPGFAPPPPPRIPPWPLTPLGVPQAGSVKPQDISRPIVIVNEEEREAQYAVEVPKEGAELLAVVLQAHESGNVDLYTSVGRSVEVFEGSIRRIRSDFASISPRGEEILVISKPQPKTTYWFIVENREDFEQTFEITAWLLPEIRDGQTGAGDQLGIPQNLPPALGRYLQTAQGLLGLQQYRLEVPKGATRLTVQVEGEGDLNLHIRIGQPVGIRDEDGQVLADISAISLGSTERIALSGKLLQTGAYYIAIEGLSPPQRFTLSVTLETTEGSQQTTLGGTLKKGEQQTSTFMTLR